MSGVVDALPPKQSLDGAPGASLKVGLTVAGDEAQDDGQDDRSNDGDDDADDQAVLADTAHAEVTGEKSSDERANETNNHVHEESEAGSLHEFSGEPACDNPDDDLGNQSMTHVFVPPSLEWDCKSRLE